MVVAMAMAMAMAMANVDRGPYGVWTFCGWRLQGAGERRLAIGGADSVERWKIDPGDAKKDRGACALGTGQRRRRWASSSRRHRWRNRRSALLSGST